MSKVHIANLKSLSFLSIIPKGKFKYPFILNNEGNFDWFANEYLLNYGGNSSIYGIRPKDTTVIEHSYSIAIFISFIEEKQINIFHIKDRDFCEYADELKRRPINNDTIKRHLRKAIDYLLYIQEKNPEKHLITYDINAENSFGVHVTKKQITRGSFKREYFNHFSMDGLTSIFCEIDYIRDDEVLDWIDAIYHTKYHPTPDKFVILRWKVMAFLLDSTGSRISELECFTRDMIKEAYKPLQSMADEVLLKKIPIKKGKYKGKERQVLVSNAVIQLTMEYIELIEETWPDLPHDFLFVSSENGKKLSGNYLKNYSNKVISNSKYAKQMKNVNNHSFRHRFITIKVANTISEISKNNNFTNILSVAFSAVRKLTLHANNTTLGRYVHLAQKYNQKGPSEDINIPSFTRIMFSKISRIITENNKGFINSDDAIAEIGKIVCKF